ARDRAQTLAQNERRALTRVQEQTLIATGRAEALAREDYVNRVNRAYREVEDDNVALAESLLHGCPAGLRGWEWHFVKRLCNLERLTVEVGPGSVNAVAFSPDGAWVATGSNASTRKSVAGTPETIKAGVDLWDVKSGRRRQAVRWFQGTVLGV